MTFQLNSLNGRGIRYILTLNPHEIFTKKMCFNQAVYKCSQIQLDHVKRKQKLSRAYKQMTEFS